uniref:Uncharacterized protein n=1 Tax=Sphaerodactylus townsendi TaxID=933632 RepID=A0ACB8EHJ3_9SAUR
MENPAENPSKAAEYLKELNKIIETQQELLEKQKLRIDELEQQVAKLYHENACLRDEHQRHLATCSLLLLQQQQQQQQGALPAPPRDGQEDAKEENGSVGLHKNTRLDSCSACLRDSARATGPARGDFMELYLVPSQAPSWCLLPGLGLSL